MTGFVSTDEAAKVLGVSRPTVIKYLQEGKLPSLRTGKAYKIAKTDLAEFAGARGMDPRMLAHLGLEGRGGARTGRLEAHTAARLQLHAEPLPLLQNNPGQVLYFLCFQLTANAPLVAVGVRDSKFFIGRHSLAHLIIQDNYVSNIHGTLFYQDRLVKILDQSTNGTRVGSRVLSSGDSHVIGDGDQFGMGSAVFTLAAPDRIDLFLGQGMSAQAFHTEFGAGETQ